MLRFNLGKHKKDKVQSTRILKKLKERSTLVTRRVSACAPRAYKRKRLTIPENENRNGCSSISQAAHGECGLSCTSKLDVIHQPRGETSESSQYNYSENCIEVQQQQIQQRKRESETNVLDPCSQDFHEWTSGQLNC